MLQFIIMVVILVYLVIASIVVHLYFYPLIKICGDSMYPTLKDGEFYIGLRESHLLPPIVGRIYVFEPPDEKGKKVVKRLTHYDSERQMCYFEGDNSENSYDSRHYGWVPANNIKVMIYRKVGKR